MRARTVTHIGMYLAIIAFFGWLVGQFFHSDMGILESREKQRVIAELKANIAAIRRSAGEKYAELEKLTRDPGAIRAYALLYGMAGGIEESAPPKMPPAEEQRLAERAAAAAAKEKFKPKPFFARHPILIVLAAAICLGVGALLLQQRRQTHRRQTERAKIHIPRVS